MIHDSKFKLGAKQLRVSKPSHRDISRIKRREIYIVCDNVLDTYNIGSIFRLADAVGAKCVYLCGGSETPPNPRIAKASVGCDKWVPWQYASTATEAIEELKGKFSLRLNNNAKSVIASPSTSLGVNSAKQSRKKIATSSQDSTRNDNSKIKIIAIEQGKGSVDFREANYLPAGRQAKMPMVFVVGHETEGVSKEVLEIADEVVEIPMFGVNKSLNVMVSLAIVLFRSI